MRLVAKLRHFEVYSECYTPRKTNGWNPKIGGLGRVYFQVPAVSGELLAACNLPQSNLWVEAPDSLKFSIEFMIRVDIS